MLVAWFVGGSAQAWDEPSQVDGVYQIGTASELEWFAEYVNSVTGVDDPEKDVVRRQGGKHFDRRHINTG